MILILSEKSDLTTFRVIKWLKHYKRKYFLVTDNDRISDFRISEKEFLIFLNGKEIELAKISAYWYRRGSLNLKIQQNIKINYAEEILRISKNEESSLIELIHNYLTRIPHLSSIYNSELNRIDVFLQAISVGLNVPQFRLLSRKKDLENFRETHSQIIVKPIKNGISLLAEGSLYTNYTDIFTNSDIEELSETFFPSLFMQYVEKKYEVRVFYFNSSFYSMAIFSQSDESTQIDFRRYNKKTPNRISKYKLPVEVEKKIEILMKRLKLKTGSIDLIFTSDNRFVFLEINPIGQFLNLEDMCNYKLTKMIAEYLANPNEN